MATFSVKDVNVLSRALIALDMLWRGTPLENKAPLIVELRAMLKRARNQSTLATSQQFAVLCYAYGNVAYFTTQELKDQRGDDWNDTPWEHNAGEPYTFMSYMAERGIMPYDIIQVQWEGSFTLPGEGEDNSSYCVDQINDGDVPWLQSFRLRPLPVIIMAGTRLSEFFKIFKKYKQPEPEVIANTVWDKDA